MDKININVSNEENLYLNENKEIKDYLKAYEAFIDLYAVERIGVSMDEINAFKRGFMCANRMGCYKKEDLCDNKLLFKLDSDLEILLNKILNKK